MAASCGAAVCGTSGRRLLCGAAAARGPALHAAAAAEKQSWRAGALVAGGGGEFVVAERWRVPAPTVVQNTGCAVVVVVCIILCRSADKTAANLLLLLQSAWHEFFFTPPSSLLPLLALALRCNKFGHLGTCADAMADDDPPIMRVASCTGAGAVGGSSTSPPAAPAATSPSACVKRLDGAPPRSLVSVELGYILDIIVPRHESPHHESPRRARRARSPHPEIEGRL